MCPSSQHEPISCFYSRAMPWGLERWHGGHDLHFITFSCYRRQALLSNAHRRELFLKVLEEVRRRFARVSKPAGPGAPSREGLTFKVMSTRGRGMAALVQVMIVALV